MRTRDRILEAALRLFNEEGVGPVSTHRLAAELGMSVGNLYYHFKGKPQIIDALFVRFEATLGQFDGVEAAMAAIDDLWLTLHLVFEVIERFEFVYRDIDSLMRDSELVRERAPLLTSRAIQVARSIAQHLVDAGVLIANPDEADALAQQLVFTVTCWPTFARLQAGRSAQSASPGYAAYQVLTLLMPYVHGAGRGYIDYLRSKYPGGSSAATAATR